MNTIDARYATPDTPYRMPTAGEMRAFTARIRDLSDRLARFELVDQHELDQLHADHARLLERIELSIQGQDR